MPTAELDGDQAMAHGAVAAGVRVVASYPYNRTEGSGPRGIIAAGFAFDKLLDVLGDPRDHRLGLLKLGVLYPLPRALVASFLAKHD
jgi:TPP-dependent indolepyruvate ferredoxin oxidoreductase alpha subunit